MENKNLKNVLMAAGLAVFAGVLTLGVNAAFGLDAPSQDPAGAALHSPVFDEVDVQGGLKNTIGNEVFVQDPLKALSGIIVDPGWGITALGNLGKVIIKDNLFVAGHDAGIGGFGIHINGNEGSITSDSGSVIVKPILDAKGTIKNSTVVNNPPSPALDQPVKIDDALEVTNNAVINGNLFATQNATITKNLTVSGALNTKGMWSNGGVMIIGDSINQGALVVTDNIGAGKDLNVAGNINASSYVNVSKDLNVSTWVKTHDFVSDGALWSNGSAYFKELDVFNEGVGDVTISDGMINADKSIDIGSPGVDGKLSLKGGGGKIMTKGTTNGNVSFDNPILQTGWIVGGIGFGDYTALNSGYAWTGDEPISVVAGANGVFFEKGSNGTAYQTQLGKIDTSGNLSMLGNVKAAHLGDFQKVTASKTVPWNKTLDSKTVTCPVNYKVIDCYGKAVAWSNADSSVIFGRDVNFIASHVNPSNTCTVSISVEKNLPNPTGIEYIATALCFNPNAYDSGNY